MSNLAKCMALFWTLAEGMILLYLRWGYLRLGNRPSAQKGLVYSCAAVFLLLAFVVFLGQGVLQEHWEMAPVHKSLYRWVLWDFLCTLWVFLEGCIMVLVIRIYRLLSRRCEGEPAATGPRAGPAGLIPWAMGVILFGFCAWYSWWLIHTALLHQIEPRGIHNIAVFYVRICGILWIAFEWVVAVCGLCTWSLLRKVEGKG